mmetsp:Transcript_4704/g.8373  ORF Transcript_4704/g.8373 Transcript_4704/m.8373 type:complete len:241 (-) Transcript_4704:823-1545(-)
MLFVPGINPEDIPPLSPSPAPPVTAATFSPPTQALIPTIRASSNLVPLNAILIFLSAILNRSSRSSTGNISILFSTTIKFRVVISAMTRHSAVWVCIPLVASTTRRTMSMIWAPPMMVRMRDAWPGQSTRVTWRRSYFCCRLVSCGLGLVLLFWLVSFSLCFGLLPLFPLLELPLLWQLVFSGVDASSTFVKCSGNGNKKAEKPKSNVIPLARDCLDLSNAAVDKTELSVLTKDVLPVST